MDFFFFQARYWQFDFHTHTTVKGLFFCAQDMHFHFIPHSKHTTAIPHHPHIFLINVMEIKKRSIYTFYLFCWHLNKITESPAFPCQRFLELLMVNFLGGRNVRSSFSGLFFTKFTTQVGNTMCLLGVPVILYSAEIGYWLNIYVVMHRYNMG